MPEILSLLSLLPLFLLAMALVLAPLAFHELGHWALLHRYKVPIDEYWLGLGPALMHLGRFRIGMLPIGGALVPEPDAWEALAPRKKMWVALAGPLASLLYGLVFLAVARYNPELPLSEILVVVANLSFVLAAINMLPIPPLDGFQAYANFRAARANPLSPATLVRANRVGSGLVYGVGFFVLGLMFFH